MLINVTVEVWLKRVVYTRVLSAGPVVVVGIREGSLWLVDAKGQPFMVPVNHAGLKARCLAAQGNSIAAKALAERGVLPAFWIQLPAVDTLQNVNLRVIYI